MNPEAHKSPATDTYTKTFLQDKSHCSQQHCNSQKVARRHRWRISQKTHLLHRAKEQKLASISSNQRSAPTNTLEANLEPKFQQSTNFNIHVDKYLYVHYLSYRSTGDWGASDPSRALPFNFPAPNPPATAAAGASPWWSTNGQKIPRSLPWYPLPSQHDNRKFLQKEEHYQKGSSSHEAACWPDVLTTISPPNSWAILIVFSLCPPRHLRNDNHISLLPL